VLSKKKEATEKKVAADERGYIVKEGDKAPDFELKLTDGIAFNKSLFELNKKEGISLRKCPLSY